MNAVVLYESGEKINKTNPFFIGSFVKSLKYSTKKTDIIKTKVIYKHQRQKDKFT